MNSKFFGFNSKYNKTLNLNNKMFYNTDKFFDKEKKPNILIDIKSHNSDVSIRDYPMEQQKIKKLEDDIKSLKQDNIKIGLAGIAGMVGISTLYIMST